MKIELTAGTYNMNPASNLSIKLQLTGANCSALTSGSVDVWVKI